MKEITKRTVFGGLFVIVVIGSVLLDFWAFAAVMTAVVALGTHEVCKLLPSKSQGENGGRRCCDSLECGTLTYVLLAFAVATAMLLVELPFRWIELIVVIPVVIVLTPFLMALFSRKHSFVETATCCWTSLFFVALPCYLMLLMYCNCPLGTVNGKMLAVMLFALIWINDIFAYLSGMAFGVHPLFKRISPKKTVEGSLGGCAMTILAAYLVNHFWLHATGDIEMMGLAAVIVVSGSLGDLCESMLKRQAGVKDSGNVIPGHGGILDRFDAMFFAVPFAFCYFALVI